MSDQQTQLPEQHQWPHQTRSERQEAARLYCYGKVSAAFEAHVKACEKCGLDGLCMIGAELNAVCLLLEKEAPIAEHLNHANTCLHAC